MSHNLNIKNTILIPALMGIGYSLLSQVAMGIAFSASAGVAALPLVAAAGVSITKSVIEEYCPKSDHTHKQAVLLGSVVGSLINGSEIIGDILFSSASDIGVTEFKSTKFGCDLIVLGCQIKDKLSQEVSDVIHPVKHIVDLEHHMPMLDYSVIGHNHFHDTSILI